VAGAPADRLAAGCTIASEYPTPIVDAATTLKYAKDRLYALPGGAQARAEASDIQQRHGSRKSGLPPSVRKAAPRATLGPPAMAQPDLFGDLK
jgi:deoxyribodipyrimidine photo-lyase